MKEISQLELKENKQNKTSSWFFFLFFFILNIVLSYVCRIFTLVYMSLGDTCLLKILLKKKYIFFLSFAGLLFLSIVLLLCIGCCTSWIIYPVCFSFSFFFEKYIYLCMCPYLWTSKKKYIYRIVKILNDEFKGSDMFSKWLADCYRFQWRIDILGKFIHVEYEGLKITSEECTT